MIPMLITDCAACGVRVFCDPDRVPSIRVNGERAAICRACHARWNEIHRAGLEPTLVLPGAYIEPDEA
jgi:hypothetical protein